MASPAPPPPGAAAPAPAPAPAASSSDDTKLLFAMIVYALIGMALHATVYWLAAKIAEIQRRERRRQFAVAAGTGGVAPGPS